MHAVKKQRELDGFERETIPELEQAVGEYVELMYKRRDIQAKEKEAKETLLAAMENLEQESYTYVDGEFRYETTLSKESKLKVKRISEEDEE